MNLKVLYPCAFTVGNLTCGFLAITHAVQGRIIESAWLILVAAILDGLDGFLARKTQGESVFGKQFDSFADFVSFGIAPMVVLYGFLYNHFGFWAWAIIMSYIIAGAFRLIRFNLSQEGRLVNNFRGLPITSAGICLAGYILLIFHYMERLAGQAFIIILIGLLIVLMISNIRFSHLIYSLLSDLKWYKIFILVILALPVIILPQIMIFIMIMAYIIGGIVRETYIAFKKQYLNNTN